MFRFGSYSPTPTSYSLIGQLYTFKLVDQLRSLIMIRDQAIFVNNINCLNTCSSGAWTDHRPAFVLTFDRLFYSVVQP